MYNGASYSTHLHTTEALNMSQPLYQYDPAQAYLTPPVSPQPQGLPTTCYRRQLTHLEQCMPNFVQEKVLGTGAYGTVYLVRDINTGVEYACKALNKFIDGRPVDLRTQQFQQTEMELHFQASAHPNVVSVFQVVDTPTITYVFLEYCPEGDLFANITEYQRYDNSPDEAKSIFLQILRAVAHCHSLGIYHRDLKPENILVSHSGTQAKLADFGLATTDVSSRDFGCGSTFYMSPECHDVTASNSAYSCEANDIWSLGVILVNLTCGRNPWKVADVKKDSTFKAFRSKPDFLKEILPISDDLNDILKRIFVKDPTQRISLPELYVRVEACMAFSDVDIPFVHNPSQQYYKIPVYESPCDTYIESASAVEYIYEDELTDSYSSAQSSFADIASTTPQPIIPDTFLNYKQSASRQQYIVQPTMQTSLASTVASGFESFFSTYLKAGALNMSAFAPITHTM